MSEFERHVGEIQEVSEKTKSLCNTQYIELKGKLYKFIQHDEYDVEDEEDIDLVPLVTTLDNGTIQFDVTFYNGVSFLAEILENNMSEYTDIKR